MKKIRENLIEQTRDGYNRMAKDWAGTRMNFWLELTELVRAQIYTKKSELSRVRLLDLGCGNARFYREISDLEVSYRGCDISTGLISQAHLYHPELDLIACDARKTPYPKDSFDIVVSFAVVHHFPDESVGEFFNEIYRVLSPGGVAVVTAWDIWKTRKKLIFRQYLQNVFNFSGWKLGDTLMSFTQHSDTRFVRGFSQGGLLAVAKKSGFTVVSAKKIKRASKKGSEQNIVLILKK